MAEPGGERTAAAGGRGHLRASRTDRERVIEQLKDAFVQDRLTQEELDTRVGLALASRTYADLADLTADIPVGSAAAEPATAGPAAEPAGSPARTLAKAARRSGICMLAAFALVGVVGPGLPAFVAIPSAPPATRNWWMPLERITLECRLTGALTDLAAGVTVAAGSQLSYRGRRFPDHRAQRTRT